MDNLKKFYMEILICQLREVTKLRHAAIETEGGLHTELAESRVSGTNLQARIESTSHSFFR